MPDRRDYHRVSLPASQRGLGSAPELAQVLPAGASVLLSRELPRADALPQPVREYAATRASAPGPALSRLSLLGRALACPSSPGRDLGGSMFSPHTPQETRVGEWRGGKSTGWRRSVGRTTGTEGLPEGAYSGRSNSQGWSGLPRV